MVEAGVLENPKVNACYGLHVQSRLPLGTIETRPGTLNASTDELRLEIFGCSGHAAYPENSVDAIVIAAQVITALQTLVSRNVSPLNYAVLSFGAIEGGTANNIICDHVTLKGTLRTADPELRSFSLKRIADIAQGIASGMGGSAKLTIVDGYAPLVNHTDKAEMVLALAREDRDLGEDDYVEKTYLGATEKVAVIDVLLSKFSNGWKTDRMSRVSRAVLRLCTYELLYTDVPPSVALNEAVELTKKFDDSKARAFVNGVLNSIKNEIEKAGAATIVSNCEAALAEAKAQKEPTQENE